MAKQEFLRHVVVSSLAVVMAVVTPRAALSQQTGPVASGARFAADLGPAKADQVITLTVHMALPDEAAFEEAINALYTPGSPTFHRWMTDADLRKFAPPQEHVDAVRRELESHGLGVLSVEENGFSLRARGSLSSVESAFGTSLHLFQRDGSTFRAPVGEAKLTGTAGGYVDTVSGLESHAVRPLYKRAVNFATQQPPLDIPVEEAVAAGGLDALVTPDCLSPAAALTLTTSNGGSAAKLPVGNYTGNFYLRDTTKACGYTAATLQAVYGLPAAYAQGLDGKGQTIVLVEAYGYPTALADANAFAALNGLPALNSSNFSIVYPEGKPSDPNAGILLGWNVEIALDLDWAHAMAPGAKIVLVASSGQDNEDFQASLAYVAQHHLGNSVSNSWEADVDLIAGRLEQTSYDRTIMMATARGISVNFSTGDSGDEGLGSPVGSAGVPSVSPHATAVGGTSVLNNVYGTGYQTTGWGTVVTALQESGSVLDPPQMLGFQGGGGGGESIFFPKPSWQKALPGTGRQTPDVSAVADPYTGVPVVVTIGGKPMILTGVGGTSLASPVFSAIWAIANQKAGSPLGQAARRIATLNAEEIDDVQPLTTSSITDVTGVITDAHGKTFYSPEELFSGSLYTAEGFTSAFYNPLPGLVYDFGFGLDTSLTVTPGWDNVTGYGTPNGLPFINAVAK